MPILANSQPPSDGDFERESLRLILRLLAALNIDAPERVRGEAQALITLWCSTPGHGAKRFGMDAATVNKLIVPEAAEGETRPPVRILPWAPPPRDGALGL